LETLDSDDLDLQTLRDLSLNPWVPALDLDLVDVEVSWRLKG